MAFFCCWQGWCDRGPLRQGLCAWWYIAIAWAIVNHFQCSGWEAICVALDWFVAWVGVIGLKNVVVVLCWWDCMVVLQIRPLSLELYKEQPKQHWFSIKSLQRRIIAKGGCTYHPRKVSMAYSFCYSLDRVSARAFVLSRSMKASPESLPSC